VQSLSDCCSSCGGPDRYSDPLLPYPVESAEGTKHVFLHASCAPGWYESRTAEAVAELASLGIHPSGELEDNDYRLANRADAVVRQIRAVADGVILSNYCATSELNAVAQALQSALADVKNMQEVLRMSRVTCKQQPETRQS
jgi:hypothetical protein